MTEAVTFLDGAAFLAELDGYPARAVPTLLRRIRHFHANGLIPAEQEEAGRQEYKIDVEGICLARLYLFMNESGWDTPALTKISHGIHDFRGTKPTGGRQGMPLIMRDLAEGLQRDLTLRFWRGSKSGDNLWQSRITMPEVPTNSRAQNAMQIADEMNGRALIMTTTVPLREIFCPAISAFEA